MLGVSISYFHDKVLTEWMESFTEECKCVSEMGEGVNITDMVEFRTLGVS